jgi:ubiquinone/menaquinone biosynthesis C-methylase UbiE
VDDTLRRELEFHDKLATRLDAADMPPRTLERLESAFLSRLGDVKGKRLLELGCGSGDLTLVFARAGAAVTALDLSPGMVGVAKERVERFAPGSDVRFHVGAAEHVAAPDDSFDLIVGKWILHHTDLSVLTPELSRLLTANGRAVFIENSGLNPILRVARDHVIGRFGVRRVGTPDEHPLLKSDYRIFESHFERVDQSYPQFDFMRLLDRQIFRYRKQRVSRMCNGFDDFIERRVPALHRYSFRVIVELAK